MIFHEAPYPSDHHRHCFDMDRYPLDHRPTSIHVCFGLRQNWKFPNLNLNNPEALGSTTICTICLLKNVVAGACTRLYFIHIYIGQYAIQYTKSMLHIGLFSKRHEEPRLADGGWGGGRVTYRERERERRIKKFIFNDFVIGSPSPIWPACHTPFFFSQ